MDIYKNIKQDIKTTLDYVQIQTIFPQNILGILYNNLILRTAPFTILRIVMGF